MTSQTGDHMSDEKHVTVGRKRWRVILPTLAIGVAAAVPAQAQVVTPSIYPAPCSGTHCLNAPRGEKSLRVDLRQRNAVVPPARSSIPARHLQGDAADTGNAMIPERKPPPSHAERLIRALMLLATSVCFSVIAWLAGAYRIENQTLAFGLVGAIIVAAVLVSRFCAKLVTQRFFR